jgi:pimeloyl-ACP methyl ester carboxylesterase
MVEREAKRTNPVRQGVFKARDGTPIYYEVFGVGRPLLFCYGLLCRREHWRHQLDYFRNEYQVIQFDYRGHQYSGRPENDRHLTLEWCAKDAQDLLNHLGIEEVVVLGHSMGVSVLNHLLLMEERVKGAVFICGTVKNPFEHMFYSNRMNGVFWAGALLHDLAPQLMDQIWKKCTERNRLNVFFTSRLGFNPTRSEEHDVVNYMEGVHQTPFAIFNALMRDYRSYDGREDLAKISQPVLVIAGENDFITPLELQEEIADLLAHGELLRIPGGSHNAHTDYPEKVNEAIAAFLKRLDFT